MFVTEDFILSLKLSLIAKIFNKSFAHIWKDVIINQLRYPDHPLISIENCMVKRNCFFLTDITECYKEWKLKAVAKIGGSVDHCVWGNSEITGMWSKTLWNNFLINKGVLYISHFLNDQNPKVLLSFDEFRERWGLSRDNIAQSEYTMIRWAIREYMKASNNNVEEINTDIYLSSITSSHDNRGTVKGQKIRDLMTIFNSPDNLAPLKEWCKDLNMTYIDWIPVFNSIFYCTTNNYKLIQFQYKLLMRISTCKYMRYKMKIEKSSPDCSMCHSTLETLPHIFLHCSHTQSFKSRLKAFITLKLDNQYRDPKNYHFLACNHDNKIINYMNMVSKWYISKQFQNQQILDWLGFKRWITIVLTGEKSYVINALKDAGLIA